MKKQRIFENAAGNTVTIKSGFSWPACIFGPFWALVKGAWTLFFILAASYAALIAFDELVAKPTGNLVVAIIMLALYISYMYICGKKGNEWLASSLLKKGYKELSSSPSNLESDSEASRPST